MVKALVTPRALGGRGGNCWLCYCQGLLMFIGHISPKWTGIVFSQLIPRGLGAQPCTSPCTFIDLHLPQKAMNMFAEMARRKQVKTLEMIRTCADHCWVFWESIHAAGHGWRQSPLPYGTRFRWKLVPASHFRTQRWRRKKSCSKIIKRYAHVDVASNVDRFPIHGLWWSYSASF